MKKAIAGAAIIIGVFMNIGMSIARGQESTVYNARVECSGNGGKNVVFYGPYQGPGERVEYAVTYNSNDPIYPKTPQRFRVTSPPNVDGEMAFAGDIGQIMPGTYGASFQIDLIRESDNKVLKTKTLIAPATCDGAKRVTVDGSK